MYVYFLGSVAKTLSQRDSAPKRFWDVCHLAVVVCLPARLSRAELPVYWSSESSSTAQVKVSFRYIADQPSLGPFMFVAADLQQGWGWQVEVEVVEAPPINSVF